MPLDSFLPRQCSCTICTFRLSRQSTSSNHHVYPVKLHFTSNVPLDSLSPCTKRTSVSEVRLVMHALFQRLQRYGAIANIALVNLTDLSSAMLTYHLYIPLVSSVHIVQSSQCEAARLTFIYERGSSLSVLMNIKYYCKYKV